MKARSRQQRGQVLILVCATLLVLVVAVLGTVNLGHALHERIRLQNNADAAAYSTAAAEARAFNLYALANRAQASHYVSAMVWQSTLSFLFFTEAFLTDVLGVLRTLERSIGECDAAVGVWAPVCAALNLIPEVAALRLGLALVAQALEAGVRAFQLRLQVPDLDRRIGREIIPAHRALNEVLAAASTAAMRSALEAVQSSSASVLRANDPGLDVDRAKAMTSELNACLFDRAHARAANGSPLEPNLHPRLPLDPRRLHESDPVARAKRVMAGVANGSRYACDADDDRACAAHFITARTGERLPPKLERLPAVAALVRPMYRKWGQTRLLSHTMATNPRGGPDGNMIRHHQDVTHRPQGMLAQGDNLGADDLYWLRIAPLGLRSAFGCGPEQKPEECWGDPRYRTGNDPAGHPFRSMLKTSVWALNPHEPYPAGGIHWRVQYPHWPVDAGASAPDGPYRELGLHRSRPCLLPLGAACPARVELFGANVRPVWDGNHPWAGMTPFSHFEPGHFSEACPSLAKASIGQEASRGESFNQPSSWALLEKGAAARRNRGDRTGAGSNEPALLNAKGELGTVWERPLKLDLESELTFTAVARAETYYHRPGNWAEVPNFFNPFWRPRLAPVAAARAKPASLESFINALPEEWRRAPYKVLTH